MKSIYTKLLIALGAVFLLTASAQAAPYIPPDNSPIFFTFNNLEQIDQGVTGGVFDNSITIPGYTDPATGLPYTATQGNWGVFNISTIQDGGIATDHLDISGGTPLWADSIPFPAGQTAGQIHGVFGGINLSSPTTATGGFLDLYWTENDGDDIDNSWLDGSRDTASTVAKFSEGTFLARLNFASGIIAGDPNTTIQSNISLTAPLPGETNPGQADSFANVDETVVGLWTDLLNGDWFYVDPNGNGTAGEPGETRDVRFSNFFNRLDAWNDPTNPNIVGARSNDPGRVYTAVTIPEPGTMILFGFGLLGLAGAARRKND